MRTALNHNVPLNFFRATMFVMGAGMGLVASTLMIATQDAVEWTDRGVATASNMFFRTIGGAIIVGALGALLARGVAGVVPQADLAKMLGPERSQGISKEAVASYAEAIEHAMTPLFWVIAAAAITMSLIGLLFPDVKVKPRGAPPKQATAPAPETAEAAVVQALD